jgi:hypothetical protein
MSAQQHCPSRPRTWRRWVGHTQQGGGSLPDAVSGPPGTKGNRSPVRPVLLIYLSCPAWLDDVCRRPGAGPHMRFYCASSSLMV